ncbi:MAG: glycosyltransferase family 2 protein [Desulfovibrio sp.]|nr:glycosyltransferase family 2 protein [Desulfovibrio sp.]
MEQNTLRPAPNLVFVIPCYNEEETLPTTMERLGELLAGLKARGQVDSASGVCYVDDGSKDGTWRLIEERHKLDPSCRGVKFAGNAGHQNAVWAGMDAARQWNADCAISMDADLQDDPGVAGEMIERYREGCEIVYGVRDDRSSDTPFKRWTARAFYALMSKLGVNVIPDHADYRLVSRAALQALESFDERNLYLRGLFPVMGFKSAKVYYKRRAREHGQSKYPLTRMIALAWQGVTSTSAAPLRMAGFLSFLCALLAIGLCCLSLYKYIMGEVIQGWTSLVIVVLFLGSAQLFCLSIIGEYIAKIFTEVRHRPRYIIEKYL